MSKYKIWLGGKNSNLKGLVKTYPFKIQAYMWCWLHGYVNKCGRYGYCLDDRIEIIEVKYG